MYVLNLLEYVAPLLYLSVHLYRYCIGISYDNIKHFAWDFCRPTPTGPTLAILSLGLVYLTRET